MSSEHLNLAKRNKNDEFYTKYRDIEVELRHYKKHFKNKIVYCNCDDPSVSNFFKYFYDNFKVLGLSKLIASCYKNQMDLLIDPEKALYCEYDGGNLDIKHLKGSGDFREQESIEFLKQADIVVTNPPFSLFRKYVDQLIEYDKKFLIIGNMNAITYAKIFRYFMDNKLWLGCGMNISMKFKLPNNKYSPVSTAWFTNLKHNKRNEELVLYKKYTPEEYPKYDNYEAINVNKTCDIPMDYDGTMGVPISFMRKHNPEQFEILGITDGNNDFEVGPSKRYKNIKQINKDNSVKKGNNVNGPTLLCSNKPDGIYYTADNTNGYLICLYARILIKNKKR